MSYQQPPNYPGPGGQYPGFAPDHPKATTVLVLGIVGIVACAVTAPIAWVMGNRVVSEIDASGGQLAGRATANAGRILGIVGCALWIFSLVIGAVLVLGVLSAEV